MDNGTVAGVVVGCVLLVALILGLFFCSKQTNDKGDKMGAAEILRAMYTSKMAAEQGAHHQATRPSAQFDHHQVYDRRSVAGAAPFIPYVTSGSSIGSVSSGQRPQHMGAPRPSVQMQPIRPSVHSHRPM
jgi:hypothetical protein